MKQARQDRWTVQDSVAEYGVDRWGDGYFNISEQGTVVVSPSRDEHTSIDLKALVDQLGDRGLSLPILLRFNGILRDRLQHLHHCFAQAIEENGYQNRYRCVFPIKVNQQREVVQQIVAEGAALGFGVEAGSKPELLAAIAMSDTSVPIVCNGFKDEEYIRLAMMAQRLGRTVFPVVEKASELDLIFRVASAVGVRPTIGMRVKLATRGSGRWQASGGYRSKFGLTVAEVLASLDRMIELGFEDCFQLLHFHVGSQIGNIRQLKSAILEAAQIYVDLQRRGAAMGYLDVGGGLGVDYDGTQTDSQSSMNYTIQEYANDVVYHVQSVCDEAGVPHPQLISESGRAVAAHHSILVMETLGVTKQGNADLPPWAASPGNGEPESEGPPEDYEQPVRDLWDAYANLTADNMMEKFHDAQLTLDMCMNLFSGGYLPLEQRVAAENLYFALCHRVRELAQAEGDLPAELEHLDRMLSDIYFVNFSLFQSMPDAWAIDQLFPIMPIHRLGERPTRHAVLGDITCDSDGKVDSFVSENDCCDTLLLHPPEDGQPYQLAVFMVGAYQEILGDLHNLFGDTHAVHVECEGSAVKIRSIVKGDTVSEVLGYVQYDDRELLDRIGQSVEDAISDERIDHQQAGRIVAAFEKALAGYTYLEPTSKGAPMEDFEVPVEFVDTQESQPSPLQRQNSTT
ncbi:biosynthetic arginine decarboxylase [Stieleria sp. ICT_E10.1]|uniref:biosynthetic arginine decarboxylase n=1 Tax=Stieleria sedimenti TaxID=2976331 RepID=UPI00217FA34C|nr:biosynthetic arginine decarboxylase [Stieleria sedimenti]MCS7465515.1 biosynthetic arginine decarboxylase [Stieleria sedimenti]